VPPPELPLDVVLVLALAEPVAPAALELELLLEPQAATTSDAASDKTTTPIRRVLKVISFNRRGGSACNRPGAGVSQL
jgi:hypothetical protein